MYVSQKSLQYSGYAWIAYLLALRDGRRNWAAGHDFGAKNLPGLQVGSRELFVVSVKLHCQANETLFLVVIFLLSPSVGFRESIEFMSNWRRFVLGEVWERIEVRGTSQNLVRQGTG